jgi:hypothetical protein
MHLLYSQAVPVPEFASLSIIHKRDISGVSLSCHIGEPLLLPSPLSSLSVSSCIESLTELHLYLNSILKMSSVNKNNINTSIRMFIRDDEGLIFPNNSSKDNNTPSSPSIQLFRPQAGHGIALHYLLIRDRKKISNLFHIMRISSKASSMSKNSAGLEKDISAILLCVGMSGIPLVFGNSPLVLSIRHRMGDCVEILCKNVSGADSDSAIVDVSAAKLLLTTLLLTENEDRVTNTMESTTSRLVLNQEDEGGGGAGLLGSAKKKSNEVVNFGMQEEENPLLVNSADQARVIVERLAVLSICESETLFRKFEGRNREAERGSGKKRLRKAAKDADLDGFDFRGVPRISRNNISGTVSLSGSTETTVPSSDASFSVRSTTSSGSNLALKGPRKDTSSRVANRGLPLLRPNKDDARSRRTTMGQLGSSSRDPSTGVRTAGGIAVNGGAGAFGSSLHSRQSVRSFQSDVASLTSGRSHSQGSKHNFDPFQDIATRTSETDHGSIVTGDVNGNDFASSGPAKVLVNIALNEDLTCFYKLSKMSSCSVEGVLQVQVKANTDEGIPFFLLLRDPSNHIQSIQENKKFADSMAESFAVEPASKRPDYIFTISVPKADNYFPVMRYKCGNELRPVPIVSIMTGACPGHVDSLYIANFSLHFFKSARANKSKNGGRSLESCTTNKFQSTQ